jgi:catechol 2,3-dioxygenase-like lactoylglutathione lyase family enzyme
MFTRIMYTTLFVRDQDRSLEFYTENFGFVKRSDYAGPEGRFLTMSFEGQDIEVVLWPGTQGQGHASAPAPGPLIVESTDLRKDFETLQSKGVQFVGPAPEDYPFGVRIEALDPDGNRVSLRQRRR